MIASASLGTGVLDLSGMTGGSVTVSGSLTAGDLTVPTATQSFDVALSGGGTITSNVDFTNQDGSLTIGSSGFEFSAGATKTIGTKSFGGGTISASSGGLLFGTSGVTLTGSTTFNAAATAVTLGAVSGSYNLILAGSGTDVIASASLGTGVLDLSGMTGGSVTVSGSLTAGDLTVPTATQSFDVALSGGGTITSNVDFTNQDGSLTIGSSGFEFSAGATKTIGTKSFGGGTISASSGGLLFGTSGVTLTGSTTFNAAATAVTLGAVSGSYNLILAGSGTDVIASASLGTGVLDLSGMTGGSVTVSGSLTAGDLTVPTATQSFDVALSGGGTITNNVDFTNQDGSLTIGSSGFEFSAGATKTIGTKSFGGGTISASSGGLLFGTSGVTLTGSTTFNAAATAVTLGAVSGSYNLILAGSGTDVIASASLGTGVLDLSGMTGGSVTVSGSLTAGDLTVPTATQSFDVALSGGGTITSNVDFTNQDGSLTIGSSGFEFSAGATKTIGTKSFGGGTISASSGGLLFGTSGVTLTGSTTFNAAATAVTLGAVSGSYNLILAGSGTDVIASASLGTGVLDLSGMTGGSVTVSGSLTAGDLTVPTATQSFDVALSGGGTITNNVDFTNQDGSLTIGSSGFEFSAGATKTIGTKSFGGGTISASSGGLLFGTSGVTLTGSTTFNAAATAVTLGAVSGSYNLILAGSGTDVIASASLGTGVLDLSGMTGGSVTVSGSLTAGDLTVPTATQSFDVALSGGGTITKQC